MNTGWLKVFTKLILGLFAALTAFCIFLLIAMLILVNSNAAQTQLFNYATSFLNDIGIHWQAGSSDISAKTHIRFKDLNIRFDHNLPLAGEISIETFHLNYDLREILSAHVTIDNFTVNGLDAKLALKSKEPPVGEESAELEFVDVKSIFDAIPGYLEIKKVTLRNINLAMELAAPGAKTKVQLVDFSLDFNGVISSTRTNLMWSLGAPLNVEHEMTSDKSHLSATTGLSIETKGSLDYISKGDRWSLQAKTQKLEIQADNTRLDLNDDKIKQAFGFVLARLRLSLRQELNRELAGSLAETVLFGLENSRLNLSGDVDFDDLSILQKSVSHQTQLSISRFGINHSINAKLLPKNHLLQAIAGDGALNLKSKPLKINSNNEQTSINDLVAAIDGNIDAGKFRLGSHLTIASIQTKLATDLNAIHFNLDSRGDMEGKRIDLGSKLSISKQTMLDMDIIVENLMKKTQFSSNVFVSIWRIGKLGKINALHQKPLGKLELHLAQKLKLLNEKPIWDYNVSQWPEFDAGWENTIDINQAASSAGGYVSHVQVKSQGDLDQTKLSGSADIKMKKIWHPMLKRKIDGSSELVFMVGSDLKAIKAGLNFGIDGQKIFELNSKLDDTKGKLFLSNKAIVNTNSTIYELSEKLKPFDGLGAIQLNLEQTGRMTHSLDSAMQLDAKAIQQSLVESELSMAIVQTKAGMNPLIRMNKPVIAKINALMRDDALNVDIKSDIRAVDIPNLGSFEGIKLSLIGNVGQLTPPKKISVETRLSVLSPRPVPELTNRVDVSNLNLNIESNASVYMNDLDDMNLKEFKLSIGDKLLQLVGSGVYVDGGKARVKLLATSDLKAAFAGVVPAEGNVLIPIEFRSLKDNIYALDLAPEFDSVSIEYGDFSIKKLNGLIKVKESIKFAEDGRLGFAYLDEFNPFARVDYENIQQLYRSKPVFWFESLRLPGAQPIGPMTAKPEVRQNLVLLNNVTLNAFDGSLVGRLLVNIDPNDPNIGFLGRFTRIKPALMTTSDKGAKGDEYISGRSALVFDITKRLAKGRLDITTIGKSQLLDILNILDPKYEDAQINNARKALALSYPEKVSVEMDQGLMNMTVKVSGVLSKSFSIYSIPLTPLIQAHLAGVLTSFEQIFKAEDLGDG